MNQGGGGGVAGGNKQRSKMKTASQSVKMVLHQALKGRKLQQARDCDLQHSWRTLIGLLLVAISLRVCSVLAEIQDVTNKINNEDQCQMASATKLALDFEALAWELQQNDSRRADGVLKVICDINNIKNDRRQRALKFVAKVRNEHGQIIYDDAIHSKRVGREHDAKMSANIEGVSRSDEFYFWKVLHNETAVLVVRSINKYYYWDRVQNVGAFILLVIILAGNSSILHRLKLGKRRRSNVNYFIVHLAIADLLVGIFSLTLDTTLRMMKYFPGELFACQATKFFTNFFIYSSTNLLVALSIDRWEAVVKPLAFTKNRSRGLYLVVGSWVLAAITSVPVTFFMRVNEIEGVTQCWIEMSPYVWRVYMIYLTCLLLVMPTLIIAICYIHIVYTIWSKGRLGVGGGKRGERRDKSSNFSSSFYGASPDSLQQESSGSVANRLQARTSNLSEDSARLEHRASSRRILWGFGGGSCGFGIQRPLGQEASTRKSKSAYGNRADSRWASSDLSAQTGQTGRQAKFKRSNGTIAANNNKQMSPGQRIGASKDSTNLECRLDGAGERIGDNATSLAGRQCGPEDENNTAKPARVQTNDGCCSVGQNLDNEAHNQASYDVGVQNKHRSQVDRQCGQMTQTASENNSNSNNNNNRPSEPMKSLEVVTGGLEQLAAVSQRQHKSSLGRVASQGLRMLSFARSHSSSSVSSTPSSGSSSSSSVAMKSRQTVANPPARSKITETDLALGDELKGDAKEGQSDGSRQKVCLKNRSEQVHEDVQKAPAMGETVECSIERANELPPPPPRPGDDLEDASVKDTNGNHNSSSSNNDNNNHHFDLKSSLPKESQTMSCNDEPKFASTNDDASNKGRELEQIDRQRPLEQSGAKFGGSSKRDRDFVAQQHGSGVIPKARIKTIKMTLVIVVTYILCWSPFVIVNLLTTFGYTEHNHFWHAMSTFTQTFAHINSAVNPLIFWLFSGRRSQTNAANRNQKTNQLNSNQPAVRQLNKIATNGAL